MTYNDTLILAIETSCDETAAAVARGTTVESSIVASQYDLHARFGGVVPGTQYYTIQKGDTLYAVAKQFYGDGMKYPKIFEANREVIEDADKIYPGQKIRIPILG